MAQPPDDDEEDLIFNVEEVQKIVRDNIELCLGGNMYSHSRTPQWITIITEKTMSRLNKLNKPFKYILEIVEGMEKDVGYFCPEIPTGSGFTRVKPRAAASQYIIVAVRVTITQKNGAGLHTAAAYFWDTATDGTCTVRWENKFMYCIVNVWGLALQIA